MLVTCVTVLVLLLTLVVYSRGRPIICADIKHFSDYRYRPFSKQICRSFFFFFFYNANKHTIYR